MATDAKDKSDFRGATELKKAPKAAVDGVAGFVLANSEVSGTPDQVFHRKHLDGHSDTLEHVGSEGGSEVASVIESPQSPSGRVFGLARR